MHWCRDGLSNKMRRRVGIESPVWIRSPVRREMVTTIRTGPLSEIDHKYRKDPHCNVSADSDRFSQNPAILPIQFSRGNSL
jgi:hypothetical protein